MNTEQYRQIRHSMAEVKDLAHRLDRLEGKYSAMCEVFEVMINRRAGRPTKADIERLEALQARMHGTVS